MKYVFLLLCSVVLFSCNTETTQSSSQNSEKDSTDNSSNQPTPVFEGRHAPVRGNSTAKFNLEKETETDYQIAKSKQIIHDLKDRSAYLNMKQDSDLCWNIPLVKSNKKFCPGDVDQYKLDYVGRWEERDALIFEVGISGFHPLTTLVELETGWEIELEGYLHISPGSRWVVGIANEPVIWVGMYIYDANSLNMDRVFEVGEPDGGIADAYHRFNVNSPVWVSDQELHVWEADPQTGERSFYVIRIEA